VAAVRRLFFALWPDRAVRERLEALAANLGPGWRPVLPADLHLTVLFLGQVPDGLVAPLCAAVDRLGLSAFEQALTQVESWAGGTLYCCAGPAVAALETLHDELAAIAVRAGLQVEKRAYRPHVTLARAVRRAPRPLERGRDFVVRLAARALVLAESGGHNGEPRYRHVRTWPLADGAGGNFPTNG
jgi:2'-5' RNA ligase